MEIIELMDQVKVRWIKNDKKNEQIGVVIGRTIQEKPRYDITLNTGEKLLNIEQDKVIKI
jgi:hypothetical protein|tara:strand:- start:6946 stop:7125 length:180 start_codon:yes stop_codon:yes gene_type:complete